MCQHYKSTLLLGNYMLIYFVASILFVAILFVALADIAGAQQAPDPALVQKVAGQLERQRNDALNAQAICSANLGTLQEEIEKLKKQLEAKKDDK